MLKVSKRALSPCLISNRARPDPGIRVPAPALSFDTLRFHANPQSPGGSTPSPEPHTITAPPAALEAVRLTWSIHAWTTIPESVAEVPLVTVAVYGIGEPSIGR